ncbi:MAG TPA: SpaA isopeptide-forming pilin-related protein, partial [Thermomicrobiales bacterium]|nr:SpaA isopeptide-forming pilin-related protein [Thermomicrobiales bacterium]
GIATTTIDLGDADETYTVTMETPPACAVQPEDQALGTLSDGDEVDLTFMTTFAADCDLGGISAYAYVCPDSVDASSTDYMTFQQGCLQPVNGLPFSIAPDDDSGQLWTMMTGEYGIDGRAPLVGLVPNSYILTSDEADPNSLVVFCATYDGTPDEAVDPASTERMTVSEENGVTLELESRQRIACDFFAFKKVVSQPTADPGQPEPTATEATDVVEPAVDSASIEFHVATCQPGYTGTDYFTDCADMGTAGVTFSVVGQNTGHTDSAMSSVPPSPGFGIAVVTDLPADTYTMSEDVPGDFASRFVYCADAPGGGDRLPTPESSPQEFDIDLAEGQAVICDWFIIPDLQVAGSVLRLTDFTCPAGFTGASFVDITSSCTDATSDVSFNLSNGKGFSQDKTTNSDGKVRWTNLLPADDYLLTSSLPGDALDRQMAFCGLDAADYIEYTVENGAIDLDPIAEGQQLQCLWFQVPTRQLDGDGSIELHKFECPGGTTGNYYDTCHNRPLGGIDFELDGPRGLIQNGTTADDGLLTFSGLPKGAYVLTEDAADYPVAIYVVVCTQDGKAFDTTYDDATGLRVKLNLPEGANIVCDWFNIPKAVVTPVPGGGNGSITVILSACVKDAKDISDFATECSPYGADVAFSLKAANGGSASTVKTDATSKAIFAGLKDGTYSLDQVDGDWCKAQSDRVDSSGNLIVQNGGNTNVYIFNCGVKQVNQLPATGSGPLSGQSPMWLWLTGMIGVTGASMFIMRRLLVSRG